MAQSLPVISAASHTNLSCLLYLILFSELQNFSNPKSQNAIVIPEVKKEENYDLRNRRSPKDVLRSGLLEDKIFTAITC